MSYTIGKGYADEITLPDGKKFYTGVHSVFSIVAKESGWPIKLIEYEGCCIYCNINDRAKDKTPFPIKIDGVDIYNFIDEVAKPDALDHLVKVTPKSK